MDQAIEDLDIDALLTHLAEVFRGAPIEGSIVGRTALRDAVTEHLGCSQLEAEELVDTLIAGGQLRLVSTPDRGDLWTIVTL
jgi:hypothetical protein